MASLLTPIELAVNAALSQDPDTCLRLKALEQHTMVVHIEDLHQYIQFTFSGNIVKLSHLDNEGADLLIAGNSLSLLKLCRHPDYLFSSEIRIHGDVQFAKQLQDVLNGFDFDWEQQLADIFGELIAQPLAYGLRQGLDWLSASNQSFQQSLSEYLREETQLLPDKILIEDYMQAVDKLRADCDRLEARIKRLGTKS